MNLSEGLGVDKISMSFPVTGFEQGAGTWSRASTSNPGTPIEQKSWGVTLDISGGGKGFVGVQEIPGGHVGKVEFNPARIADPESWNLVGVDEVRPAAELVFAAAQTILTTTSHVEDCRLKRVDVAREFEVDNCGFYVQGLAPIKRPYARLNAVFNSQQGGAQTLQVGSGAGVCRLYDKAAEVNGRGARSGAPGGGGSGLRPKDGILRWETEARSRWLDRYAGMKVLEDVTWANVIQLGTERFEWSRMGVEVAATDRVIEQVMRSDLSSAEASGFLGYLLMASRGWSVPRSKDTMAKYNRLVKDLNVVLSPSLFENGGFVGRLDWESGEEIVRVA